MRIRLLTFLFLIGSQFLLAQSVYHHISNKGVYEFLEEMADLQIISVNAAIKPWTREFIAQKLSEVRESGNLLNSRQRKELDFYLRDFNKEILRSKYKPIRPDLFYYADSLFLFSASPVLGIQYFRNENGSAYHRWNGGEAFAYLSGNLGFYASLRDNYESVRFSRKEYLNQRIGGGYKIIDEGGEFSEMRGGVSFSNRWMTIAMIKDHFSWGSGYNGSNIFSGKTPSFGQVSIRIRPASWFEFNYVHGWLASGVVDSLRTYQLAGGPRIVYHPKYLVANMFTLTPFRRLNISLGNSMIYSDIGFNAAYVIPVFFYKSLDHTYSGSNYGGQNAQMFFDISSRQIKHLHLYATGFIDEVSIRNMLDPEKQSNYFSMKAGLRISNLFLDNSFFTFEWTRTHPATFQHIVETTTFESSGYNLGHYLRDNAEEIYVDAGFKPMRTMKIELFYSYARKGDEYGLGVTSRRGLPFMETVKWENTSMGIRSSYQLINDGYAFLSVISSHIRGEESRYAPDMLTGKTLTISAGLNWGF